MSTIRPTFLICGAKKAGTTALANYLREHPNVILSHPKETNFFRDHYEKGLSWLAERYEHYDGEEAIGEASVWNMYAPTAAERIYETVPEAKLIFVLRDPVHRALSQYYYDLRCGLIEPHRSFEDVVTNPTTSEEQNVVAMGFYDEQLEHFMKYFDRKQMHVLLSRDLRESTKATVEAVARFIGVDPDHVPSQYEQHNQTRYIQNRGAYNAVRTVWTPMRNQVEAMFPKLVDTLRSKIRSLVSTNERPDMTDAMRAHLSTVYAPHTDRLKRHVDLDLSHWI